MTACSRETLADAERYIGREFGRRANVVYGGISLDEFKNVLPYTSEMPYVLGLGRLVFQKGFDLLIEAFYKAELSLHLVIAGEGPERGKLEQLAMELGLRDRVKFVGRADRKMAVALFSGCRFFVTPSRLEPMGIVNLEAMALGKAVVASNVGGIPEIVVEGETGLLFPPGDVIALSERMRYLEENEYLRLRFEEAGKHRARGYGWSEIADQYVDIYRRILSK